MNGKFIASRSIQLATMLIRLAADYEAAGSLDAAGKAAVKGAAAEIAALEASFDNSTAYGTAVKSVLTSMTNVLDNLGG